MVEAVDGCWRNRSNFYAGTEHFTDIQIKQHLLHGLSGFLIYTITIDFLVTFLSFSNRNWCRHLNFEKYLWYFIDRSKWELVHSEVQIKTSKQRKNDQKAGK